MKRGIDLKVIEACFRAGILYESADYHNAVFVGKDEAGAAVMPFFEVLIQREKSFKGGRLPAATNGFASWLPPKRETKQACCVRSSHRDARPPDA